MDSFPIWKGQMGRMSAFGLAGMAFLISFWFFSVLFGLAPIGYMDKSIERASAGFGARTASGLSLGLQRFFFFEGQEIYIDYDVTVHEGQLSVFIYRFERGAPQIFRNVIEESGEGRFRISIPETGAYRLAVGEWPGGVHDDRANDLMYDIDYEISWGIY